MSDAMPSDVGHENAITGRELVAASAAAQFYNFADRCMDWAKTTRSIQERAVYTQMGLQWLAAGAKLQTALYLKSLKNKEAKEARTQATPTLDADLTAHH